MSVLLYIGIAQDDEWASAAAEFAQHARRLEASSAGATCHVLPYTHATPEWLHQVQPQAVVLSGIARPFASYRSADFVALNDWLQTTHTPTLAICGSHQVLGFCFNTNLRTLAVIPDERLVSSSVPQRSETARPLDEPGEERGYCALTLTAAGRADPLFAGLGPTPTFFEDHQCEMKRVPPGFELLGSTAACRIQAIRHTTRPLYGVQFHPEAYSEAYPAGRRVLENFLSIVIAADPFRNAPARNPAAL